MAEHIPTTLERAQPLIAQCRRDIEAAWRQVEAARDALKRTRWLIARWEARARMGEGWDRITLHPVEGRPAGMRMFVEPETRLKLRRRFIRRPRVGPALKPSRTLPRSAFE
jgi:hypothetical protein